MANGARSALAAVVAGMVLGGSVQSAAAEEASASLNARRVRSEDSRISGLMADAVEGSSTFRALVDAIAGTDGIVYVNPGSCRKSNVHACLLHQVTAAGANRVLYILIDVERSEIDMMGSAGHELQHALEILGDARVTSGIGITSFYRKRGTITNGSIETSAAIDAGAAVRQDLKALARAATRLSRTSSPALLSRATP